MFPPAWAPPLMPQLGCFAGQRLRSSRWYRRSARLLGRSAGCSAAWQRASFGTKRPPVQIRPPRPRSRATLSAEGGLFLLLFFAYSRKVRQRLVAQLVASQVRWKFGLTQAPERDVTLRLWRRAP